MLKHLLYLLLLLPISTLAHNNTIPPQAFKYKEAIETELNNFFSHIPDYNYVPSLIEHESCITLRHRRCWNPESQLLTPREQGLGFFQFTRTFRPDGSIRFDTLTDMRNKHKEHLREATWDNFRHRPDLQIRMGILMLRDNFGRLSSIEDEYIRLQFTNAAHNTGLGNVQRKRRECAIAKDCNPQIWFKHVDSKCAGLTRVIYGRRSACDIVRDHTHDVFINNLPKYQKYYFVKEIKSTQPNLVVQAALSTSALRLPTPSKVRVAPL